MGTSRVVRDITSHEGNVFHSEKQKQSDPISNESQSQPTTESSDIAKPDEMKNKGSV
jgi:hypothetical protein